MLKNFQDSNPVYPFRYAIFISGPTASGKTSLSLQLASKLAHELKFSYNKTAQPSFETGLRPCNNLKPPTGLKPYIINADVGQFYTPLNIGTAKPDWKNSPFPHLLFDILNEPKDLNSVTYRALALEALEQIWKEHGIPIFVGGSLFYLKSIFFPPDNSLNIPQQDLFRNTSAQLLRDVGLKPTCDQSQGYEDTSSEKLWERLNEIDPDRAKAIHPHDTYRVQRALKIWESSGVKPSLYEPTYQPPCHARFIFLNPPRNTLYENINQRTIEMFNSSPSWIDEAMKLRKEGPFSETSPNTNETSLSEIRLWESFLKQKKLIGYPEIFDWIDQGADPALIPPLITLIQQKTRNYAKRQVTFWKKFRNLLLQHSTQSAYFCKVDTETSFAETSLVETSLAERQVSTTSFAEGHVPETSFAETSLADFNYEKINRVVDCVQQDLILAGGLTPRRISL